MVTALNLSGRDRVQYERLSEHYRTELLGIAPQEPKADEDTYRFASALTRAAGAYYKWVGLYSGPDYELDRLELAYDFAKTGREVSDVLGNSEDCHVQQMLRESRKVYDSLVGGV